MTDKQTARLFLAIPLDDIQRNLCSEFIKLNCIPNVRWIPGENLHITLLFIGDFPLALLEKLQSSLKELASSCKPFELQLDKFTYVPNQRQPSMIWQQFHTSDAFEATIRQLFSGLRQFYDQNEIEFRITIRNINIPHVTLSRLKNKHYKFPYLKSPEISVKSIPVKGFRLYESILKPEGATYILLETFDFV